MLKIVGLSCDLWFVMVRPDALQTGSIGAAVGGGGNTSIWRFLIKMETEFDFFSTIAAGPSVDTLM